MSRSLARLAVVPAIALWAVVASSCGNSKFGASSKKEPRKEKVAENATGDRNGDGRVDEKDALGKPGGDGTANPSGEGGRDSVADGGYPGGAPDGRGEKLSAAAQAIVDACASKPKSKQSFKINFEALMGDKDKPSCSYAVGGGVQTVDGKRDFIQGIRSQTKTVALPAGAIVCSQKIFSARSKEWVYDDEIILTLNGVILATTQKKYVEHEGKPTFAKEAAGWLWSWDRLAARKLHNYQSKERSDRYCYATDTKKCEMPFTQQEGEVNLQLPTEALAPLSAKIQADKKFELALHVTGDDEPDIDCKHTGIELTAEIEYVK